MDNHKEQYRIIELKFDKAEQPKFIERKGKGYIEFGEENNYPNYLIGLYNESAKHGAIVKGKCNYIYGKGFMADAKINSTGESWNDILKKVIKDDEIYRGYYLQIIWNRIGKVSDVFHIEYAKVRVSKDLQCFYVKNNWQDNKEKAREYPAFNSMNPIGSQILYIKEYNPASEYYPLPTYFQGLNYIESDIEVSRHILGNAKKGFVASTLINLNNGDPINEEHKAEVEKGLLKKFGGHDSMRTVIMFNKSKDNGADIQQLGNSMLTKEDFTNVNQLIQQEIFAAHQITSPVLFGIKTEGQLGSRNEIRDAYEIFSNTYVNERQQEFEKVFTKLTEYVGIKVEMKITPVEPLKFEFSEAIIAANLTQNEIREILGKEPLEAGQVTSDGKTAVLDAVPVQQEANPIESNDAIKNLTGRQHQNIMRIVRQFSSGKLNKAQASLLLKQGYGLSDSDINTFLGIDDITPEEQMFFSQEEDRMYSEFKAFGEDLSKYEVIHKESRETFRGADIIGELEANVLKVLKSNKNIDVEGISEALDIESKIVNRVLRELQSNEIIDIKERKVGEDTITETKILKSLSQLEGVEPTVSTMFIRYTYDWRSIVPVNKRDASTSRPFCQKMMDLSMTKTWSMKDIQNISIRLGYSVFDRCGGWWTHNGIHDYQCRHEWVANVVELKK
jgi:hypothetical protein